MLLYMYLFRYTCVIAYMTHNLNVKKRTTWKRAILSPFGCLMNPRFLFSEVPTVTVMGRGVRKERRDYKILLKNSPLNVIRARI